MGKIYLTARQTMSEWISVKDRLPEEDGKYIVSKINGEVDVYMYYTGKYDNCGWYSSPWYKGNDALYWMPFPSPPEVKDNE
jgi:hypothetical protein